MTLGLIKQKVLARKFLLLEQQLQELLKQHFHMEIFNGYKGYTKLFIYPGYKFKVVDKLITNFHLTSIIFINACISIHWI